MSIEKIYHGDNVTGYCLYNKQGKPIGEKEVRTSGRYSGVEYFTLGTLSRQQVKSLFIQCEKLQSAR